MNSLPTLDELRPESGGLSPTSLLAALFAAFAGMLVWAGVTFFTGYEVGYVAWAVGGIVGLATVKFGGRGTASAGVAAVLTVVGIAGGKLIGTSLIAEKELQKGFEEVFTRGLYQELVHDAADLAALGAKPGDADLREFLFEHSYTQASSPAKVQSAELQSFLSDNAPLLGKLHASRLSYEDWYAESTAESRKAFEADFSIVQANIEELNAIDVVFVVLGVSTAFGMVRRAGDQPRGPGSFGEQQSRKAA